MARTNVYQHFCPVARSLEVIGEKWSLLIVRDLLRGPQRFTDLLRGLGNITPKWLTARLRELESAGLLIRNQAEGKREVWYELTPAGRDLGPVIGALNVWGIHNALRPLEEGEGVSASRLVESFRGYLVTERIRPVEPIAIAFAFGPGEPSVLRFDGRYWIRDIAGAPADVTVSCSPAAWVAMLVERPAAPLAGLGVVGTPAAVEALRTVLAGLVVPRRTAEPAGRA